MSRTHKPRELVWAVIRVDLWAKDPKTQITIKEVVWSRELAIAEVERLSKLKAGKECLYFYTSSRLFPPNTSAGTRGDDSEQAAV